jgi:glycosyltransferase involved in cell wall biosynthesis
MDPYYEENPEHIAEADIVVGIPSFNESRLIPYPTQQAGLGLKQYFPDKRSVIINLDNHSSDGTKESFFATETDIPKIYISTPEGVLGKGNNLRNFFRKACDLGAKACIVVDADLKSITPKWIKHLGEPLFQDFGFVAPLYVRHKYDGTITNSIGYPLTRSVFGRRVRQPIGGDVAFSGDLAQIFLEHPLWNPMVASFGIDIWMSTIAICHDVPICQSFLGRPKIHKTRDPASEIGAVFRQIVGTIFSTMIHFSGYWRSIRWSRPTAIFGFGLGEVELPPPVEVSKSSIYQRFQQGIPAFSDTWREALGQENFSKLTEVLEMDGSRFEFPSDLWAKILFSCAVAFAQQAGNRDAIVDSLVPLYYARVYSYVQKTEEMSTQQAEEYIEEQCVVFEEARSFLDERWPL